MNNDNVSNPLRRTRLRGPSRVERGCHQKSWNCNQSGSVHLREFHIFSLRCVKIEVMNQPAGTHAVVLKRFATYRAYTPRTVTSTLLRVALEYAQVSPCVAFTRAWGISRSKRGKLTLRGAW